MKVATQVIEQLIWLIDNNGLQDGDRLPSERQL